MRMRAFALRNTKEILRDPLNIGFGLGFPLAVLFLLTAIQANVPVQIFSIDSLAPGIAVFGLSFVCLFAATLVSKDRTTSFLMRLYASPMRPAEYIAGYILPLFPIAAAQIAVCLGVSMALGLTISVNILAVLGISLITAVFFISTGLLCGSIFSDKQVGGICGALLTNLSAWLSGTWFSLDLVGGAFRDIAYALPFAHAVDAGRCALAGDFASAAPHLWVVIAYTAGMTLIAVIVFGKKMRGDKA